MCEKIFDAKASHSADVTRGAAGEANNYGHAGEAATTLHF